MEMLKSKATWALGMLAFLMVFHLSFLGLGASGCRTLILRGEENVPVQCQETTEILQRAAETYIAIILALMAPLTGK